MKDVIRSPFFYVGDKRKLMPQLNKLKPTDIDTYIEPFVGGGSSFLNTESKYYFLNDIDKYVILLHKELKKYSNSREKLFSMLFSLISYYDLSCSFQGITVPEELKKKHIKTYYAVYNKNGYGRLRDDYNNNQSDMLRLYLLLIYGFNHMIRFNSKGLFNLPVGNVDFNKNVYKSLNDYLDFVNDRNIVFYNFDYKDFLKRIEINRQKTFVFLDPPYLISASEYNKLWNEEKERELYSFLDELNCKGIKFGLTNLVHHKGKTNDILVEWSKKYKVYNIDSNYISFNDNTIKSESKEIYVTNYE